MLPLLALVTLLSVAACGSSRFRGQRAGTNPVETFAEAEQFQRREHDALALRAHLTHYLVALGAVPRPPRPAPEIEEPGAPPSEDAEWIAGEWTWGGEAWIWNPGDWYDPSATMAFGDEPNPDAILGVVVAAEGIAATIASSERDRRPARGRFRDYRVGSALPMSHIRDYRGRTSGSGSKVRDYRSGKNESWSSSSSSDDAPARDSSSSSSTSDTSGSSRSGGSDSNMGARDDFRTR